MSDERRVSSILYLVTVVAFTPSHCSSLIILAFTRTSGPKTSIGIYLPLKCYWYYIRHSSALLSKSILQIVELRLMRLCTILDSKPSRPARDILPPPRKARPGVKYLSKATSESIKRSAIRQVVQISERDRVTSKVLLFAEDHLIRIHLALEARQQLADTCLIWLQTTARLEHLFGDDGRDDNAEVEGLDRSCLFEQSLGLGIARSQGGALVGVFLAEVSRDCARLV